jgi:hypothetical protein
MLTELHLWKGNNSTVDNGGECHVYLKETDKLGMKDRKVGGKRGEGIGEAAKKRE